MVKRTLSMATKRTPTQKRITRAENGRDDWKGKAIERREENEKLKRELALRTADLENLNKEYEEVQEKLKQTTKKLAKSEQEIEAFKKKAF